MFERAAFDAFVVEADGETAGIVVRLDREFRFYASTNDFVALEGHTFRRARDAQRAVREHALIRQRGRTAGRAA
jgi:hypothetical protein